MRKAIIIVGGWEGHDPKGVSQRIEEILVKCNFNVSIYDNLQVFEDIELLKETDLIVPIWTMGEISETQCKNVSEAVASGTGIAGVHGGMCDAFRNSVLWQFITGGNWVAHPGNDSVTYTVTIKDRSHELTKDINDFKVTSEQYYMHVDPAIEILATTHFPIADGYHITNKSVEMPVAWTKMWGKGRVYFNSVGHSANLFDIKEFHKMVELGFSWASRK